MSEPATEPATPHARRAPAVIGYTAGVFDLFHLGHLNLFRHAREQCDLLIVGVTTDELAEHVKGERPVIPLVERTAIVASVRYVDHVVPQVSSDKLAAWNALRFDVLFVGDNLRASPTWHAVADQMTGVGVRVCYLPATQNRSGQLLDRDAADLVAD